MTEPKNFGEYVIKHRLDFTESMLDDLRKLLQQKIDEEIERAKSCSGERSERFRHWYAKEILKDIGEGLL